jgi:hypothetical protein
MQEQEAAEHEPETEDESGYRIAARTGCPLIDVDCIHASERTVRCPARDPESMPDPRPPDGRFDLRDQRPFVAEFVIP